MSDLEIKFTAAKRMIKHLNAIGVRYASFSTRLLTLVQVGDCWEYAQEAIIKWLLSYSKFMINVYTHARIVLTGNINTCVLCKQKRVPSESLLFKLAC